MRQSVNLIIIIIMHLSIEPVGEFGGGAALGHVGTEAGPTHHNLPVQP